jgi:hypothetical protein
MPTADEYRRRAKDSTLLAETTSDENERNFLLKLAAQWTRLAEQKLKRDQFSHSK